MELINKELVNNQINKQWLDKKGKKKKGLVIILNAYNVFIEMNDGFTFSFLIKNSLRLTRSHNAIYIFFI